MKSPQSQIFDVIGLGLNAMDTICVVESFPQPHTKTAIKEVYAEPGGQVATALVTCSRLGLKTRYLGSVGNDDAGRRQLASLRDDNIDVEYVRVVEGAATQWASIILVENVGERTILWRHDPQLNYPADAVTPEVITGGRILHLDGCDSEAALKAARLARGAGIPVVIDIDELYGPHTEELLTYVDYLIAAEEFAADVTGLSNPEDAARRLQTRYGSRVVGITMGAGGAVFCDRGSVSTSPAFHVRVADTTGAGDVFHGGFIYGLLQSWPLPRVVRFAHAAAALKCTQTGARRGIPRLAEVERFLESMRK
jgi:sulfofructose kinase